MQRPLVEVLSAQADWADVFALARVAFRDRSVLHRHTVDDTRQAVADVALDEVARETGAR
ncbi:MULTISPECIES: hypothetical protein [Jannaschia]|uniref:hypothetical protein n=1 Tax=Jannaschia TaxID=188905 RepID=UPI001C7D5B0F|nr:MULTISPECIES: hypothetical protein [unclassified Jannaschia]